MTNMTVSQLTIYPIKSTAALHQSRLFLDNIGAAFDRRFILVDGDGAMITARKHPQLLQIKATLTDTGLAISYPKQPSIFLDVSDVSNHDIQSQVWGDSFTAKAAKSTINEWFSQILNNDVFLLHLSNNDIRFGKKANRHVSFADAYPLLIIGTASLEALNARSEMTHSMAQFRPNIVVKTESPFIEDTWQHVRINDAIIQLTEPCARCVMTTINPENSEKFHHAEPIKTLSTFRKSANNAIHFGMNANVKTVGTIQLNDTIEVLDTQDIEIYADALL